jgi:hypothetical protein
VHAHSLGSSEAIGEPEMATVDVLGRPSTFSGWQSEAAWSEPGVSIYITEEDVARLLDAVRGATR